jgi:signal peptidase I
VIVLAQPIMLIIGGMVFAVILDGGTRLLGRVLPIGRAWRLAIVTPPGRDEDYIKRVIGLPGDTVAVRRGRLILNGKPVTSVVRPPAMVPVDANSPCGSNQFWDRRVETNQGLFCRLPIVRETLPNGVSYNTVDDGTSPGDDYGPVNVPAGHVFLMGDNRDHSADSRYSLGDSGLGGPVPWENIGGRAEFITFSLDGTTMLTSPSTWFEAFREGRAGTSLRPGKD